MLCEPLWHQLRHSRSCWSWVIAPRQLLCLPCSNHESFLSHRDTVSAESPVSCCLLLWCNDIILLFDTECAPRPSVRPAKALVLDFPRHCYVFCVLPCMLRLGTLGSCQFSGLCWAQCTDFLCSMFSKRICQGFCSFLPSSSL